MQLAEKYRKLFQHAYTRIYTHDTLQKAVGANAASFSSAILRCKQFPGEVASPAGMALSADKSEIATPKG